ncbi:hypothetical protein GCM10011363_39800 [Marivita lacus]|uniref:HNH endonuclease n=1 Tax=Marivita lacus TaxID=1323742 RepID=A0ABQ1L3Q2_9RHOB|nr:hypothetical protein [Marivita lacus]GGC19147.1 hypothetical protein GCM10011363_39800 [Marivita lacus]
MFRFAERPDSTNFDNDDTLDSVRDEVRRIYEAALPDFVTDDDRIEFPKKVMGKSSDLWKGFKSDFAKAQHGRCGYCDIRVVGTQYCDVDHFRPKAMVQVLDTASQGTEQDNASNVSDRKALRTIGTGYWWDAYSWANFLLSCEICNRTWKRNYFPVDCDMAQRSRPQENALEHELLFHPFKDEEPINHFRYELDGRIRGISPMGVATIETAGLWRPSLVVQRKKHLATLARLIDEMRAPTASDDLVRSHVRTILEKGADDAHNFPGMTRVFWTQISGVSWEELEHLTR